MVMTFCSMINALLRVPIIDDPAGIIRFSLLQKTICVTYLEKNDDKIADKSPHNLYGFMNQIVIAGLIIGGIIAI